MMNAITIKFGKIISLFLAVILVFAVIQYFVGLYYAFFPIKLRMFDKLEELDISEQYVVSEIEYNSEIEPEQSKIVDRRAYVMEYEGETYEVYAYELDSMESAKEHYSTFTEHSVDRDYGSRLNYADKEPFVRYYEHRFFSVHYTKANLKEISDFVNEISQHFTFDRDMMRNDEMQKQ